MITLIQRQGPGTLLTQPAAPAIALTAIGRRGPPGPPGDRVVSYPASQAIGGQRLVRLQADGTLAYASCDELASAHTLIGLTTHAASAGESQSVLHLGEIDESGWSWTPDAPVYLGLAGVPTQQPPPDARLLRVIGYALSATRLYVCPHEPILTI